MVTYIIITFIAFVGFIIMTRILMAEETLIMKANTNFFYHVVAKLTSNKYTGYKLTKEEENALSQLPLPKGRGLSKEH